MKWGFLFCVCAAILLGGCDRSTPEEKRKVFNDKWGPEVTFEEGYLLINWADIAGVTPPRGALSLKIPRAYLDSQFGGQDDKGKVDRLYIELMLPTGEPLPQIYGPMNPTDEERNRIKEIAAKRVFVVLYRDYLNQTIESIHRRKYTASGSGPNIFLDGEVGGLEKYSAMICASNHTTSPPDYKAMVEKNLEDKVKDDRSPSGCYRNDRHFILVSPKNTKHEDIVFAECRGETCWFHFNIANRTAEITMNVAGAQLWRDRVDLVRKVTGEFVISSNP